MRYIVLRIGRILILVACSIRCENELEFRQLVRTVRKKGPLRIRSRGSLLYLATHSTCRDGTHQDRAVVACG